VTGIVTDLGIELGKLVYWNADRDQPKVLANRERLRVLGTLLFCFFAGGVAGAIGFKRIGFLSTAPLAALLCILAIVPTLDDMMVVLARIRRRRGWGGRPR
jgi:hypothetical protein